MSFAQQAKRATSSQGGNYLYKQGVNVRRMNGKAPIQFRILPAFNPGVADPATSWLPCLDPSGNLTNWGAILKVVKFVGHGTFKDRKDMLSLTTLGENEFCPHVELYKTIQSNYETWGYLTEDVGEWGDRNRVAAAYGPVVDVLVANIYDPSQPQKSTQIAEFTASGMNALIGTSKGLVFQPYINATDEDIAKNYMTAFAYGDITDPRNGPQLTLQKGTDSGDNSRYVVSASIDQNKRVIRTAMDQALMANRKDLTKFDTYVNVPTPEAIVKDMMKIFNGRSPQGYHEHALLRMAFPQFQIPEPPAAPGMRQTTQGFSPPPQQQTQVPDYNAPQAQAPSPNIDTAQAQAPQEEPLPAFDFSQTSGNMSKASQTGEDGAPLGPPVNAPSNGTPATPPGMATVPGATGAFDQAAFMAKLKKNQQG